MPTLVPGLPDLWQHTLGHAKICVAVLDGPVDVTHPSLNGANLVQRKTLARIDAGPACRHGTHVASVIFGQPDGPVHGIAPHCSGTILPVFESAGHDSIRPCSQLDLARAMIAALEAGAQIINVSGGEF